MQAIIVSVLGFILNVWFWFIMLFVKFKIHKPKEFKKEVKNEIAEFRRYGKLLEIVFAIVIPIFLMFGVFLLFLHWEDLPIHVFDR